MRVDRMLISLQRLRTLDLEKPSSAGRAAHLSAASGLVRAGEFLYVIADDELHLGVFPASGNAPGSLIRLFAGELPDEARERKRRKPDLEALLVLPSFPGYAHGALLALGSGSKANRRAGALLALDASGEALAVSRACDLSGLLEPLQRRFESLNIEGAVVVDDELCLLQRGNRKSRQNALIRYRLQPLLDTLVAGDSIPAIEPFAVHTVALGAVDDVPLCFTDAAALPTGELVFSAVAEDTGDSYHDGPCSAAAIGIMSREGAIRCLHRIEGAHKVEGVHARVEGATVWLLLVTDADDPAIAAGLYAARLSP